MKPMHAGWASGTEAGGGCVEGCETYLVCSGTMMSGYSRYFVIRTDQKGMFILRRRRGRQECDR